MTSSSTDALSKRAEVAVEKVVGRPPAEIGRVTGGLDGARTAEVERTALIVRGRGRTRS